MLRRKEADIRTSLSLAVLSAAVLAAPLGSRANPLEIQVANESQFAAAVAELGDSGGTIVLLPHVYRRTLTISSRSALPLEIVGRPGTRVMRIRLDHARHISVGGLTVAPVDGDAGIDVVASDRIDLHDLLVTAAGTRLSSSVSIPDSSYVTIRRSEFTHCGDRSLSFSNCVLLGQRSTNVTVEDSRFHDCLGCDFLHGRVRSGLTVRRNRFERALPCTLRGRRCGHQDLIELFAGDRLLFEQNVFGVYREGGAQLYLTGDMDQVSVVDNVFVATDPRVPGYRTRVGLLVGSSGRTNWCHSTRAEPACVPRHVRVLGNTILSGARRRDGYVGSIRMSSRYGGLPRGERPILANNVIGVLEDPSHVCSEVRVSVSNVVSRGRACSRSDRVGKPHLDAGGRPTAASTLLIDRADRRYAPERDFTGRPRGKAPDIGAFEYRP